MSDLQTLLEISASRHSHLCPRQVLGVRMGMFAGEILGLDLPQLKKRLLTILETDGCFADGVEVATGCTLGHRTLRVEDYGKTAAVFVDTKTGRAARLAVVRSESACIVRPGRVGKKLDAVAPRVLHVEPAY